MLISKDIKDPAQGPVRRFAGPVQIALLTGTGTGGMLVDDVQVATLGERTDGAGIASARLRVPDELEVTFSAPMDISEGDRGEHSATNPLNYMVSRRFFPSYDIAPLAVTREGPIVFVVKLREPLTGDDGHVWTVTLRDEAGRPLAPAGVFRRIEPRQ